MEYSVQAYPARQKPIGTLWLKTHSLGKDCPDHQKGIGIREKSPPLWLKQSEEKHPPSDLSGNKEIAGGGLSPNLVHEVTDCGVGLRVEKTLFSQITRHDAVEKPVCRLADIHPLAV